MLSLTPSIAGPTRFKRALTPSLLCVSSVLLLLAQGCSSKSSSDNGNGTRDLHALYQSDISNLSQLDEDSLRKFDNLTEGLFTQVFGGTTRADIEKYYQDRIHYVFTADDFKNAGSDPESFANENWLKMTGEARPPP